MSSLIDASNLIKAGELVVFPTETVYGLGADATNPIVVTKIFATKNRPSFNPLIVHVSSIEQAETLVEFNDTAYKLVDKFWAGALTLVLPKKENSPIAPIVSAGLDTLAIRMPSHSIAQELITLAGVPISAPSANISGRISPTQAEHINLKGVFILKGDKSEIGLESTVVDLTTDIPVILRHGFITEEQIIKIVGKVGKPDDKIKSPGMMKKHYAPSIPVKLNAIPKSNEAFLAFGENIPTDAKFTLNLSKNGDLIEAGANLFSMLHELDKAEYSAICVAPIPDIGIGRAINDRLKRANAS